MSSDSATIQADLQTWRQAAMEFIAGTVNSDGGWGYAGQSSNSEATALVAMAFNALTPGADLVAGANAWLAARQRDDGAFAISDVCPDAAWATPLAGLALAATSDRGDTGEASGGVPSDAVSSDAVSSDAVSSDAVSSDAVSSDAGSSDAVSSAASYLLSVPVYTLAPSPPYYGYDTSIPGWPWTHGDYSFAEPTALTTIFLKRQGYGGHERVRQAVSMLCDRAVADGWNYGEPSVLGQSLAPADVPTAMGLLALADETDADTDAALTWLAGRRGEITTLFSLGWAAMAMNVHARLDDAWTAEVIQRWRFAESSRLNALDTALCLLATAAATDHPFSVVS